MITERLYRLAELEQVGGGTIDFVFPERGTLKWIFVTDSAGSRAALGAMSLNLWRSSTGEHYSTDGETVVALPCLASAGVELGGVDAYEPIPIDLVTDPSDTWRITVNAGAGDTPRVTACVEVPA